MFRGKPVWILFFALAGLTATALAGPGDGRETSLDFLIMVDVSVEGADSYADAANIVDGVCTFRLSDEQAASPSKRYSISLYRDGERIHTYHDRWLPATFRRDYTGVSEGDYIVSFMAEDRAGRMGKGSATIRVRH